MAQKHRPYLTLADLSKISAALKQSSPSSLPLITYLDTYISQIQAGLRKPNHTLQPAKPTLAQSLELEPPPPKDAALDLQLSKDREIQYLLSLPRESLTVAQLTQVQDYRYLHDLMTPQEEEEYEHAAGF